MPKIRSSDQLQVDADLDVGSNKVVNVVDPAAPQDAATKNYVDSQIGAGLFADQEDLSGQANGSNQSFTLANSPSPPVSLHLYWNGLLQEYGVDYILSGSTATFQGTIAPLATDALVASYRY